MIERRTLKISTKLLNHLKGIVHGVEEGIRSKTVKVPSNDMAHMLEVELMNNRALLFGFLLLTYLEIGGGHIFLFSSFNLYLSYLFSLSILNLLLVFVLVF